MDPTISSASNLDQLVRDALGFLVVLGLAASRPLGVALTFPVFTRAEIGGIVRTGLALGLSLPVMWLTTESVGQLGADRSIYTALLALKEFLVGMLIGFMFGLPFWAIQSVGELIDTQRGVTNIDARTDPATRSQASATSVFLGLSAIVLFVVADGLSMLARTLYDSYGIWPLLSFHPKLTLDGALSIAAAVDHLLRYALLVAGPVLALFLLLDVSILLIGRSVPRLNAYDVPPALKNVVFVVFMAIYVTYLMGYMRAELATTHGIRAQLERFLQ